MSKYQQKQKPPDTSPMLATRNKKGNVEKTLIKPKRKPGIHQQRNWEEDKLHEVNMGKKTKDNTAEWNHIILVRGPIHDEMTKLG